MNIIKRANRKGDKIMFYYDFGRLPGQRPSTGVFIYTKPKDQVQKNQNKEALTLIETKKSQVIIENKLPGVLTFPSINSKRILWNIMKNMFHLIQGKEIVI